MENEIFKKIYSNVAEPGFGTFFVPNLTEKLEPPSDTEKMCMSEKMCSVLFQNFDFLS